MQLIFQSTTWFTLNFCLNQSLKELSEDLLSSLAVLRRYLPFFPLSPSEPFAPWRGAKVAALFRTAKLFLNFIFPASVARLALEAAAKVRGNFRKTRKTFFLFLSPARPSKGAEAGGRLLPRRAAKVSKAFRSARPRAKFFSVSLSPTGPRNRGRSLC